MSGFSLHALGFMTSDLLTEYQKLCCFKNRSLLSYFLIFDFSEALCNHRAARFFFLSLETPHLTFTDTLNS